MRRPVALGLALLAGIAGCGTGSTPETVTTTSTAIRTLQEVVDEARLELDAPGLVATVRRGGDVASVASGADGPAGTPLTGEETLPIGSVTKVLTAALVLDAVAKGELSLETPVEAILPRMLSDGAEVTVRMLLDHTSGIFAVGDEGDLVADIGRLTDVDMKAQAEQLAAAFLRGESVAPSVPLLVALAETHQRYGPPASTFHYSNVNYLLLGSGLERATGQPLSDLVRERIADPLGLEHTALVSGIDRFDVEGHMADPDGELTEPGNGYLLLRGNGASGGVTSTTADLLEAVRAVVAGELLPPELTGTMLSPTEPSDGAYGLGVAVYDLACGTFHGHAGGIAGIEAIALASRDGEDGVALIANSRPADGRQRLLPIAERLLCAELRLR